MKRAIELYGGHAYILTWDWDATPDDYVPPGAMALERSLPRARGDGFDAEVFRAMVAMLPGKRIEVPLT
jgi:hypothetical protein